MSWRKDREAWGKFTADRNGKAAAAHCVAAVAAVARHDVVITLASRRSVAWPRLINAEAVPAMLAVVLVAAAADVAVVVVVGQVGMVILLGCLANRMTPTNTLTVFCPN